jgi:hypothetical protein
MKENIGAAIAGQAIKAATFVAGGITTTPGGPTSFSLGKAFGVG